MALGVDPRDEVAIDRVFEIKGRPSEKPLPLFVRDPASWRQYGHPDETGVADRLIEGFWPGPLFLIVDATENAPSERPQQAGTVCLGCFTNPTWRELMSHLDTPLTMTSANRSGTVPNDRLIDLDLARAHVGDAVDVIIADGPPAEATQATTIVDISNGPRLHREGDVTAEELNAAVDIF